MLEYVSACMAQSTILMSCLCDASSQSLFASCTHLTNRRTSHPQGPSHAQEPETISPGTHSHRQQSSGCSKTSPMLPPQGLWLSRNTLQSFRGACGFKTQIDVLRAPEDEYVVPGGLVGEHFAIRTFDFFLFLDFWFPFKHTLCDVCCLKCHA